MTTEMETNGPTHSHRARPSYDDINSGAILVAVIISAILTVVIVAFVQGLAYHWQSRFETAAQATAGQWASNEKIATQKAVLDSAPVKIETAMESVAAASGQTQSQNESQNKKNESTNNSEKTGAESKEGDGH